MSHVSGAARRKNRPPAPTDQSLARIGGRTGSPAARGVRRRARRRRGFASGAHHRFGSQDHRQGNPGTPQTPRSRRTRAANRWRTQTSRGRPPGIVRALQDLLRDDTAGDPVSAMRWTHRSLRKLCKALKRQGITLGRQTLARLLRHLGYSLRTCRKLKAGLHDPDRDRQFRYLAWLRKRFTSRGWPVISVDTKKKEWIGDFKNLGTCWRMASRAVLDH